MFILGCKSANTDMSAEVPPMSRVITFDKSVSFDVQIAPRNSPTSPE